MVKHIVLFKLKDQKDRKKALDALNGMRDKIDGLIDLETGEDFLYSERSYDIALICTLESKEALDFYQAHPVHKPVKKLMHEIRESSVAVDFEVKHKVRESIGELIALQKAQLNATWVQCVRCICSFAIEEERCNFCPDCGLQMRAEIKKTKAWYEK